MSRFLLLLRSNWISAAGALLTTLSFMLMVTTYVYLSLYGSSHNAYVGLFAFVVLPGLFVVGLVVIPIGLLVYRHQLKSRMAELTGRPIRLLRVLAILTVVNIAVAGTAGYEAMHYMDSQQFCGTLCHEVMSPTYQAYVDSPHARVACVDCHIGPGASWFVKSKLSGLRQVTAVIFDSFSRPVPTPVHDLRPARETCEQCHWPERFSGDRLVVRKHFEDDDAVTPSTNVLVLKTGGMRPDGQATGIHWHVHRGDSVEYVTTDDRRQHIPWVRLSRADGTVQVFTSGGLDQDAPPPQGERRTMDCVDCHNQPSHGFRSLDSAIDQAIAAGFVSRELPAVRKVGKDLLQQEWTRDGVRDGMRKKLEEHYGAMEGLSDAARATIPAAAEALADAWLRNVYPDMRITWGTYPSFQNHDGCMRCHDGEHVNKDGDEISMECENCHAILAMQEEEPDILEQLGMTSK
ncbi:MAG: NapC/NirT family cytochrome c [Planctomycetes bacterium]|nr:NapC/NirT family cytochrome c [Planctomycetota bacterium]